MKIIVLGGTGLIGTKVVHILQDQGHEVIAGSARTVDLLTGRGLKEALQGADVVANGQRCGFHPVSVEMLLGRGLDQALDLLLSVSGLAPAYGTDPLALGLDERKFLRHKSEPFGMNGH